MHEFKYTIMGKYFASKSALLHKQNLTFSFIYNNFACNKKYVKNFIERRMENKTCSTTRSPAKRSSRVSS